MKQFKRIIAVVLVLFYANLGKAQVFLKGDKINEFYIGYDPIVTNEYTKTYNKPTSLISKFLVSNKGYRYEKMVHDRVGLGVNINQVIIRTSLMFSAYFHFIENDYFDVFATGAVGSGFDIDSNTEEFTYITPYYVGSGIRYFSGNDLGINLNVGYRDGAMITIGLSFRN